MRHGGFQSWESQNCETLAFQEAKKSLLSPPMCFEILIPISLALLSLSPQSDDCRLDGMFILDAGLKKRKQLTFNTLSETLSALTDTHAATLSALFIILSIKAVCCQDPRLGPVLRGNPVRSPEDGKFAFCWTSSCSIENLSRKEI